MDFKIFSALSKQCNVKITQLNTINDMTVDSNVSININTNPGFIKASLYFFEKLGKTSQQQWKNIDNKFK